MDPVLLLLLALLGFMLVGSLIAVETRDLLSSVICVGAVGFGTSLVFLLLGAPDLALTQVVVEILILVVLVRVIITRRDETTMTSRATLPVGLVLLALGIMCAYYLLKLWSDMLGNTGALPPAVAAWWQNVLFAGIGLWLSRRGR